MPSISLDVAIKTTQIAVLRKLDRQTTREKVILLLTRCSGMVNVQMNLTPAQIEMAADMIVENHWMYSLEDLQLCFDRGCFGMYGELYNRLDGSVIFGWLQKYEQQRQEAIRAKKKAEIDGNNIYDTFKHPVMLDAMHKVVDRMEAKKEERPEPKRTELSPFEKMVQQEWEALPHTEIAYLKSYSGFHYDFTDYRKIRFAEELEKEETK